MNLTDPVLGVFINVISKAITDKDGNYKLQVKEGASYILLCYAPGYQLQYYNGKSNILEADKLTSDKDLTGIDFKLSPVSQAKGNISGKIVDELKTAVTGKLILYSTGTVTPFNLLARTVNTNDAGEFAFENLPNGTYYLQVVPSKGYIPAYYKLNDCGIREPRQADKITVEKEGSVTGIVVCVKKITASGGGIISGIIADAKLSGIGGAIVIAESKDLDQCSFGITENDGSYEIQDLGVGDYEITVEKFGYTSVSREGALIDYAEGSFNSVVNIVLGSPSVTSVELSSAIPTEFVLYQNYPNPFNPTTKIKFALAGSAFTKLTICDLLGREVKTLVNSEMNAGFHEVEFNAGNLTSGIYFYRLQANDYTFVKKLILMK
ncbi:hypothetical protein C0389_00115 [bacterium]|nr:hypothetical protein [bacterium]